MSEQGDYEGLENLWDADDLVDGVDEPADPLDDTTDLEDDILTADPMTGEDGREPYGLDEPPS